MKTCLMPYANNKGAHQPAYRHLCSNNNNNNNNFCLISVFVIRFLHSVIPVAAIPEILRLSLAGQTESYLVAYLKDRFSCDVALLKSTTSHGLFVS